MQEETIDKIFEILSDNIKDPKTELYHTNNFTLLIAVLLSARNTDAGVNKVVPLLFQNYDTPQKFVEAGVETIEQYIKTIGLYKTKARNIVELSRILIEKYDSQVPGDFDSLINLPGVGTKTANVVLNIAFNKPVIAVDTHVFRLSRRLGLSKASTPEKVGEELERAIPIRYLKDAHHLLILHGRYVCKARKPSCDVCELKAYCEFYEKSE